MADEIKSVVIDLKLDTGDSAQQASVLRDKIIELKNAQKENKRETEEQKLAYEATDAAIKANTELLARNTQQMKNQEVAIKSNNGSFNQLQSSLKVGEAALKNLTGAITKNADGTFNLTKEYFDAKKQVDEAKNALLLFNAGISQGNLNVGNYDNTLTGMKQKLADLQVVIENTNVESLEFDKLKAEADALSTSIQITTGKIDSMGQKVAKNSIKDNFNDMRGAAQGLTGAIGILSLGFDSQSKTGEILRSSMVALTVAQTALTIAEQKEDLVKIVSVARTKALAAGTWLYETAIKGATVATTLFKTALVGLGIAGLIIGIMKIVDAMKSQSTATQDAIDKQKEYNEQREQQNEKEIARLLKFEETSKRYQQRINNIAESESKGNDVTAAKLKLYEDQVESLKNLIAFEDVKSEKYKAINDLIFERELKLNNLQTEINGNRKKESEERIKDANEEIDRTQQMWEDYYNKLIDLNAKRREDGAMSAWEYYENQIKALKQLKEDSVKVYDDMGEEIIAVDTETQSIIKAGFLKNLEERAAAIEADNEKQKELISSLAISMGEIFADSITQTGLDLKKFAKGVTTLILDTLEKTLVAAQVEILAKEIASKSFAGIATAAIQIGLITAAFEGIKSIINKPSDAEFYEGGYTGEGNPKEQSRKLGRKNYVYHKDEYVVPSKVLNDPQGSSLVMQLEKMRVNNPIRIGGIGKADGGFASSFSKSISQQNGLTASDLAKVKLFVSVTDIDNGLNNVKVTSGIGSL